MVLDKVGDEVFIWYFMGVFSVDSNNFDMKLNIFLLNDWGIEMFWVYDIECIDGFWSVYDWGVVGIWYSFLVYVVVLFIFC